MKKQMLMLLQAMIAITRFYILVPIENQVKYPAYAVKGDDSTFEQPSILLML